MNPPGRIEVALDARRFVRTVVAGCIAVELAFGVLDYFVNFGRLTDLLPIRRLFNIAREDGLASWFGTTQTFVAGLTAWFVFALRRREPGARRRALGWLVVAVFVTFMAIDDGAQVHERVGTAFKLAHSAARVRPEEWSARLVAAFPSYTWQLIFVPTYGMLGLFTVAFLWVERPERWCRTFVVSWFGLSVLAVGMDFVEGLGRHDPKNLYALVADHWQAQIQPFTMRRFGKTAFAAVLHFGRVIEESIEMLAVTLLWAVILEACTRSAAELTLAFRRTK